MIPRRVGHPAGRGTRTTAFSTGKSPKSSLYRIAGIWLAITVSDAARVLQERAARCLEMSVQAGPDAASPAADSQERAGSPASANFRDRRRVSVAEARRRRELLIA